MKEVYENERLADSHERRGEAEGEMKGEWENEQRERKECEGMR